MTNETILWPRFSSYQVDRGYLRPSPGARITWYEPWTDFERLREQSTTAFAAYDGLLALRQSIQRRPTSLDALHAAEAGRKTSRFFRARWVSYDYDKATLLQWLKQNGALGLLLHQTVTTSLEATQGQRRLIYVDQGNWMVASENLPSDDKIGRIPGLRESLMPHAVIRDLVINEVRAEPLERTWASFFPNIADGELASFAYPSPSEEPFWRLYAEPVDSVLQAIIGLTDALEYVARMTKGIRPRGDLRMGRFALDGILAAVHPTLRFGEAGRALESPSSPSLFGLLALMALRDITRQGRVTVCPKCGRLRVSKRAIYCSDQCKKATQMQVYRRREKERDEKN